MENRISVVIPTYNRKNTLPEAIDSVINQTYQNWELFVIDDGSTDGTRELIQEKYFHESKIIFLERPDVRPKGANACRNIGIEKASGKYIAFLDSDDEWKPKYLENCVQLLHNKAAFYGCYSGAIIKNGKYTFKKESRPLMENESHIDFLLGDGFSPTPTFFVGREYALEIKFDEDLQRHQDWDFFIRFGEKYPWTFNNSINVIINREVNNITKEVDLESCIGFYQKYKDKIFNNQNKEKYLYYMYKKAVLTMDYTAEKFYKKEIEMTAKSNALPVQYPFLFRYYEFLKRKLKIKALRQFIKDYL